MTGLKELEALSYSLLNHGNSVSGETALQIGEIPSDGHGTTRDIDFLNRSFRMSQDMKRRLYRRFLV